MEHRQIIKLCQFLLLLYALFSLSAHAATQSPSPGLIFPVNCALNKDCWIVNYVDVVAQDGQAKDFQCNARTYDNHKGTDIALSAAKAIENGYGVRAALDGKVLRIRDGESDGLKTSQEIEEIKEQRKECGNAVLIDHASAGYPGLRTMYCHLKNGSVQVEPDDTVKAGDPIGQIGYSGVSEFPHLHFGVIWENAIIDPFTGQNTASGCGQTTTKSLWQDPAITYQQTGIFAAGFENKVPDFEAIKNNTQGPEIITQSAKALTLWTGLYGAQAGDQITLEITDPNGKPFIKRTMIQDADRARQYYYTGRKITADPLLPGTYTGTITLIPRNGTQTRKVTDIIIR